jgi:hypothetical protein
LSIKASFMENNRIGSTAKGILFSLVHSVTIPSDIFLES